MVQSAGKPCGIEDQLLVVYNGYISTFLFSFLFFLFFFSSSFLFFPFFSFFFWCPVPSRYTHSSHAFPPQVSDARLLASLTLKECMVSLRYEIQTMFHNPLPLRHTLFHDQQYPSIPIRCTLLSTKQKQLHKMPILHRRSIKSTLYIGMRKPHH